MGELYPFQKTGAAWLAERRYAALCDAMGLGKTAQAIVAADQVAARRVLVIAPAIARDMWSREWLTWQQIPRTIQVIRTGADAGKLHGDVIIVSYSLAARVRGQFDLLVCDEAQSLKSPAAARTKAVYSNKGGLIHSARRAWLLSGTLAPNHPGELWTHYRCLFRGSLNYWEFINRYCIIKQTAFGEQIVGANAAHIAELAAFLRPHMLQRRQSEVLPDMPELRWGHIPVMPDAVPPRPETTVQELAVLGKLERDEALSVTEQMALATLRRWTGIAKASSVLQLVQGELEGTDKICLFAVHREVISILANGLGPLAAVINGDTPQSARQALIDRFQTSDQPRVLILQINVAGTALTLHRASRVIFAETTWVPADVVQAAKRAHRIGQGRSVLASVVSLAGSIDEVVAGTIMRKSRELAELETLIREDVA